MTERERFEAWLLSEGYPSERLVTRGRIYVDDHVDDLWDGWQARALLAAGASEGHADLWARADYPVLWTRHGSGENAWYSRDGYEARKNAAGRWVLSRAGAPIFEHEYLQEVTARAFVITHDPSAEIAALRERIAGMEKDAELMRFLDVAASEGYVFDGVDAGDLYERLFPDAFDDAITKEQPPLYPPCTGLNCGATDGVSHSPECRAEHAAAVAGGRFVKGER